MEIWKYPVTFLLMNISFGSIVLLVSSLHLRRHQKLSFLRQLFVRLSQLLPLLLLFPLLMPHHLETGLVQQKIWMRSQPKTLILGWYIALIWFDREEICGVSVRQIILDEPASTEYKVWCIFFRASSVFHPTLPWELPRGVELAVSGLRSSLRCIPHRLTLWPAPNKQTLHYAIRAVIFSTTGALVVVTVYGTPSKTT